MKRLTWSSDRKLKAPEEDAGEGVWGARQGKWGYWSFSFKKKKMAQHLPFHSHIHFAFLLSPPSPVAPSRTLTPSNKAHQLSIDVKAHCCRSRLSECCSHTFPETNGRRGY